MPCSSHLGSGGEIQGPAPSLVGRKSHQGDKYMTSVGDEKHKEESRVV